MGNILNPETLAALRELDESGSSAFITEIITTYLGDFSVRMETLQEANRTGDTSVISKTAHAMKGNSLNVGADSLASLLHRIERQGKDGALCAAEDLDAIESHFLLVQDALNAYLA